MSAPARQPGLAPGDGLTILTQLNGHRKAGRRLDELPRRVRADAEDLLDAVRGWMNQDPHVGPMLEGAVTRVAGHIAAGTLGEIQQLDLKTIANFLRVVPVTRGHR